MYVSVLFHFSFHLSLLLFMSAKDFFYFEERHRNQTEGGRGNHNEAGGSKPKQRTANVVLGFQCFSLLSIAFMCSSFFSSLLKRAKANKRNHWEAVETGRSNDKNGRSKMDSKQKQRTAIMVLGYPCFPSYSTNCPCIPFLLAFSVIFS